MPGSSLKNLPDSNPTQVLDDADYTSIPQTMYLCVLMLTGEWAPTTPSLTWYSKLSQGNLLTLTLTLTSWYSNRFQGGLGWG